MDYEYNDRKQASVYSRRLKAGKRRTYFFDVRETRGNDFYLTITESRKRFNEDGYDRHKIFLYKEDFNKFVKALGAAVDHVKTELMPDYDFDSFSHDGEEQEEAQIRGVASPARRFNEPAAPSMAEPEMPQDAVSVPAEAADSDDPQPQSASQPEVLGDTGEEMINTTETSDKLASEEVEKW